jgi:hypothetical protein
MAITPPAKTAYEPTTQTSNCSGVNESPIVSEPNQTTKDAVEPAAWAILLPSLVNTLPLKIAKTVTAKRNENGSLDSLSFRIWVDMSLAKTQKGKIAATIKKESVANLVNLSMVPPSYELIWITEV